ncbi:sigma 54-interacting transcriptional regulator [Alkalihalobacillus sp. BA299]|uniref:sigma 54-interacting transcriptional regulator n=1 Tax=Alkalihalobacillus sp. BA299 TaxID=2815938 RepID=UPI001AD9C8E4|nr:sigma 54-interacting transcriptional regulator [Alkalihalobacillus sp. BA299]
MIDVRTANTISINSSISDIWEMMSKYTDPFIFITDPLENEGIIGYIHSKDIMPLLRKGNIENLHVSELPIQTNIIKVSKNADVLDFFKVFGEDVVVIVGETNRIEGYLQREDVLYYLLTSKSSGTDWIRSLLNSIPMGIIITDTYGRIENFSDEVLRMLKMSSEELREKQVGELLDQESYLKVIEHGETILNYIIIKDEYSVLADLGPIRNKKGIVTGSIVVLQDLPYIEKMAMELEYVKNLNVDLQAILSSTYDEIIVLSKKGTLLRYSGRLINDFWETDKEQLIGINLMELEHEGTFFSSIVRKVIEKKRKVTVTQESRSGKNVLTVGNPVFNQNGELERIVIALRDITETVLLKEELRTAKKESEKYKKELEHFKDWSNLNINKKIIYRSDKIENVMKYIKKISNVSSTVLLTGESGVGKEVFSRAIHELGPRSNKPFIKVNCGAIPENLLESELFGYEKGAFTGANANGKPGYFKLANKGILFLDEIGELPLNLQVKLLRVLQEREFMPIGGTQPIDVDVQIITATNKDLEEMVERKEFREDLFYRLNVIPIHIPSLRERPEDIPLLCLHFLQNFNHKYNRNNQLSQDALDLLESYSWPGNVRELQNIIERLSVTNDNELIDSEQILPIIKKGKKSTGNKEINKIIPLKQAINNVEERLIILAMEEYQTTTEAAKALGVSQSTISRKYSELIKKKERGE